MSLRRVNLRESERIRGRNGSVGTERIRSGDVSEALTKVLREETRLPRAPISGKGKDLEEKRQWFVKIEQSEWLGRSRQSSEEGKSGWY